MPIFDPKRIEGLRAVSAMILAMAVSVSKIADDVSNWLAIGLGAILSLLITNLDKLAAYVSVNKIKTAAL